MDFRNFSEPQNVEQGISNVEVNTSHFCGSLFALPAMPLKFQDIAAVASLCLGCHSFTVLFAWQAGIRYSITQNTLRL